MAFTAFLGNTLILLSLHKESSLHAPSKLLFRSLATTDLCVGIISEPLCVAYLITALNERWYMICHYALAILETTGHILGLASLFTLAAISVDRLLALLLGLRYRQVVTLRRIYLIVNCFLDYIHCRDDNVFLESPCNLIGRFHCYSTVCNHLNLPLTRRFSSLSAVTCFKCKVMLVQDTQAKQFD